MTDPSLPSPTSISNSRLRQYAWIALAIALVLAVWGIVSRVRARNVLSTETAVAAAPTVATVRPTSAPATESLVLPGSVQAYYEAPIYARTSGYLKAWHTDIGTPVRKGQLLAEIDTPEVDQQLSQARADLATAQANYQLARTTDERWQGLLASQSVSKQDVDQRASDAVAKKAAVQSAAANVARLRDLSHAEEWGEQINDRLDLLVAWAEVVVKQLEHPEARVWLSVIPIHHGDTGELRGKSDQL